MYANRKLHTGFRLVPNINDSDSINSINLFRQLCNNMKINIKKNNVPFDNIPL